MQYSILGKIGYSSIAVIASYDFLCIASVDHSISMSNAASMSGSWASYGEKGDTRVFGNKEASSPTILVINGLACQKGGAPPSAKTAVDASEPSSFPTGELSWIELGESIGLRCR